MRSDQNSQLDLSSQHVLPDDAPYLANLAALWAVDPKLARAIEELDASKRYPVEPSKSGEPTIALPSADGKSIYLHSRYQPIDEAQKLVESTTVQDRGMFYVCGFALGYHVKVLFDRAAGDAIICVLEPDVRLLQTALFARDYSTLIASNRVLFFTQPEKAELFTRLMAQSAMAALGFEPVVHAPSIQLNNEFYRQMTTWFDEFVAFSKTSVSTLVLNGKRTAENIARNIPWYVATPSLSRLKDCYKGKPAIIVSAGPSLQKNEHLLRDAAGHAVIIAVQTTLQPLIELGIEPPFVTSLDYHDICTRFFEKLPATLKTELIAEPKATSAIFDLNPGPLSLLGNDFAENLLGEMKLGKTKLPSGATVAHLAYYLAEHIGADPIIFVGQDLGFSDGLCYSPGTSYDDVWRPELSRFCTVEMKQWEQIVRDRHILRRIPDHQGRTMYTEERLFTYLQQFERDFANSKRRIIDATEGGALKRGAEVMPLARALEECCREPLNTATPRHPELRWERLDECISSLTARAAEAVQIEQIARDTLPLLQEVREHIEDQSRVNRAIGRIDLLRAKMNDLGATYGLIMQLSQNTELKRFHADRRIAAAGSKLDANEKQRRQVGRDIDNVASVAQAAAEFQRLMTDAIANVEQFRHRHLPPQTRRAAA